jgi:hypothetical protein
LSSTQRRYIWVPSIQLPTGSDVERRCGVPTLLRASTCVHVAPSRLQ